MSNLPLPSSDDNGYAQIEIIGKSNSKVRFVLYAVIPTILAVAGVVNKWGPNATPTADIMGSLRWSENGRPAQGVSRIDFTLQDNKFASIDEQGCFVVEKVQYLESKRIDVQIYFRDKKISPVQTYFNLKDFSAIRKNVYQVIIDIDKPNMYRNEIQNDNQDDSYSSANSHQYKEEWLEVSTEEGDSLMLRKEPSSNSSIITKMPNGSIIKILSSNESKDITIKGHQGRWCKVKYRKMIGYCFGGYLQERGFTEAKED